MDRKCKQKVVCVAEILAVFLAVFFGALFCNRENAKLSRRQAEELSTLYPEKGEEMGDICAYYDRELERNNSKFFLFLALMVSLLVLLLELGRESREKIFFRSYLGNLQIFQNRISQFQKGNYGEGKDLDWEGFDVESYTAFHQMEESIFYLGKYCSMLKEKLEQEEDSTKSLVTDISHQLKTPLAAVRLNYEMMQEECLTEEERREFLQREKQEIDKLESLLEELMKLSRLESSMIRLKRERANLKELLLEAMNQVYMKAHHKGVELQADIPKEDIFLFVDKKWTVEAFVNVLDNGIKYSLPQGKMELRVSVWKDSVLIEIEDEGIGIPSQELHKIFHRFYRGEKAAQMVKEGAGVGLYLTRKILEEQDGIIVAKRKKQGTVFQITMKMQDM